MHDGRVGRAGAHADVGFFFDQQDAQVVAGQGAGGHAAHHAPADDDDVVGFQRLTS